MSMHREEGHTYPCPAGKEDDHDEVLHLCVLSPTEHWAGPTDSDGTHRCTCGTYWVQRTIHDTLTVAERAIIHKLGALWNDIRDVVAETPTRDSDLAELIMHIHALQRAIMAQAAARGYPDELRLLGGIII